MSSDRSAKNWWIDFTRSDRQIAAEAALLDLPENVDARILELSGGPSS